MKKLFTIDDFMVAFISALGYGFGETIARLSGWPEPMCIVACFALGILLEEIISCIVFSKAVQKKKSTRILIYAAILLVFLTAQYVSIRWMGVSMIDYVEEEFMWVVGLPILGFIVNMIIRWYHVRKIRRIYGDGSEGFVFDLDAEDIEETNRQNRPITGEYDKDLAVKTRGGIFVGEKYKNTIYYLGIPYAKPPVGELRWRAPEILPPSDEVFEAVNFGASATQVEHKGSIFKNYRQSEDCLYLNICIGKDRTDEKKPVLVLFHHGDFSFGGSVDPLLHGSNFVSSSQDIVLVSFNYRLGIFGFIDFSGIPGGEEYTDTLNLGLLDQIAALEWIKENIAAFGGDPDRITVMGFDSGATSILMLAASRRAKGLFKKAFVFNGNLAEAYDSPEGARALAGDLLKETQTSSMDELLKLDTKTLKEAAQRLWKDMCAPTCDGILIPAADVDQAFKDGAASDIEFVIGIARDETKILRAYIGDQNYEDFLAAGMDVIFTYSDDTLADEMQKYIETQTSLSNETEARSKLLDQWIAVRMYRSAVSLAAGGSKVHLMYWGEEALIDNLGSGTVDFAATQLKNSEALRLYGNVMNADLSEALRGFLNKFVNGNDLQMYRHEIQGTEAFEWKPFPRALIVSDGKLICDRIEDRLTEVKGLFDYIVGQ